MDPIEDIPGALEPTNDLSLLRGLCVDEPAVVVVLPFEDDVPLVASSIRSSEIKMSSSVPETSTGIVNDPTSSLKSASDELLPLLDAAAAVVLGVVDDVFDGNVGTLGLLLAVGFGGNVTLLAKERKDFAGQDVGWILALMHVAAVKKHEFWNFKIVEPSIVPQTLDFVKEHLLMPQLFILVGHFPGDKN